MLNYAITLPAAVLEWEGNSIEITKISRLDMGAYLCIASNGVPPTVSKRIKVSVDCKYTHTQDKFHTNTSHPMVDWPYMKHTRVRYVTRTVAMIVAESYCEVTA